MIVYLAGLFHRKAELAGYRLSLLDFGYQCSASWVTNEGDVPGQALDYTGSQAQRIAQQDLQDVASCDALVLFTEPRGSRQPGGGRFVEAGYALALGKPLFIIGEHENLFLGSYPRFTNFAAWLNR